MFGYVFPQELVVLIFFHFAYVARFIGRYEHFPGGSDFLYIGAKFRLELIRTVLKFKLYLVKMNN